MIARLETITGDEIEICLKSGHDMLPKIEDVLRLGFDPADAFVFDKKTGARHL
jgi:hypothetical protein